MMFRCADIQSTFLDGEGTSIAIYFQGCTVGCNGCQNKGLQDIKGGYLESTDVIAKIINDNKDFYDSVVFTGGDPLDQVDALVEIAKNVDLKKVLYTGRYFDDIPQEVRDNVDRIIDGPYIEDIAMPGRFPVSPNQRIWEKDEHGNWNVIG